MDFTLDAEQVALRDAVRGLLGKSYESSEDRRAVTTQDPGWSDKTWAQLAEMGALGLPFAEADGGMGAGPVEVSIVAEEIGRVIAPEPYVEAVVLAGGLVAAAGTDEQRAEILGALSEGTLVPAFAHNEPGQRYSEDAAGVTATKDGDTWTLTGVKEPVIGGARADLLIVSAAIDGGVGLFTVKADAEGLTRDGYTDVRGWSSRSHRSGIARLPRHWVSPAPISPMRSPQPLPRRRSPTATSRSARCRLRWSRPRSTSRPASSSAYR